MKHLPLNSLLSFASLNSLGLGSFVMFMLTSSLFLMMYIQCLLASVCAILSYLRFVHESCNLLIYLYTLFLLHLLIFETLLFVLANFNFFSKFLLLRLLLFWKSHLMNLPQPLLHNHFRLIIKMLLLLYFHWLWLMYSLLIFLVVHCFLKPQELDCSEYFYFITS